MPLVHSFEHHLSIIHNFYIEVGADVVNIKRLIPYNIVNIFKDARKNIEVCNKLMGSLVVVEQHHLAKVDKW